MGGWVVLDVETQGLAGRSRDRGRLRELRVSVAVSLEVASGIYHWYTEERVTELIEQLRQADLVVGFNLYGFDYPVLQSYTHAPLRSLPTVDIMDEVQRATGCRVGLDRLAEATLGVRKTASGVEAVRWWRDGQIDRLVRYCQKDVEITWRLFMFGLQKGYLLYRDHLGRLRRVAVEWKRAQGAGYAERGRQVGG